MPTVAGLVSKNVGTALTNYKTWGGIMYNVLDNGLIGGGVVDDTAALQALINAAIAEGRKAIYFPHGTYKVTAVTNADQVIFFGDNASFVGGDTGSISQFGAQGGGASSSGLINVNFDVWQRGTSLPAGTAQRFLADRWAVLSDNTTIQPSQQSFTFGQVDVPNNPRYFHRNIVVAGAGVSDYAIMSQNIENVRTFAGQKITVSFWAKSDADKNMSIEFQQKFGSGGTPSTDVYEIGVEKFSLTTQWKKFSKTVTIPSVTGKVAGTNNNSMLVFTLWLDSGSSFNSRSGSLGHQSGTFDFAQVQICAGDVALPFQPKSYAEELALCQRYFQQRSTNNVDFLDLRPSMRIAPTITGSVSPFNYDAEL